MTYNYYILVLRWVFFSDYTIPYAGIFQTLREALRGSFKLGNVSLLSTQVKTDKLLSLSPLIASLRACWHATCVSMLIVRILRRSTITAQIGGP